MRTGGGGGGGGLHTAVERCLTTTVLPTCTPWCTCVGGAPCRVCALCDRYRLLHMRPPLLVRGYQRQLPPPLLQELEAAFLSAETQLVERGDAGRFDVHLVHPGKTPIDVQSGLSVTTLQVNLQALLTAVYKLHLAEVLHTINLMAADIDTIWSTPELMEEWSDVIEHHIMLGLWDGSQLAFSTAFDVLPQFAATFNIVWAWLALAGIPEDQALRWLTVVAERVQPAPRRPQGNTERSAAVGGL